MVVGYLVVGLLASIGSVLGGTSVAIGAFQGLPGSRLALVGTGIDAVWIVASILLAAGLASGRLERLRAFLDRSLERTGTIPGALRTAAIFLLLCLSVMILGQLSTAVSARCLEPPELGRLSYLQHLLYMGVGGGKSLALLGLLIWIRGSEKKRASIAA